MTNVQHIATIRAYPIKDELGGGFRGKLTNHGTGERRKSERCETLEDARHWAKTEAYSAFAKAKGFQLAPIYGRGRYYANVWILA